MPPNTAPVAPTTTTTSPITPVTPPASGTPVSSPATTVDPNALLTSIVNQQMGQSGMVSSSGSTIQTNLAAAVAAAQQSGSARDNSINNDYNDQETAATTQGAYALGNGRAAGTGGLMNLAALNDLTGRTESQLKSLETAKQQALLNNDAQQATQIAALQTQAYQFQQTANQQVFTNILGIGTLQNSQQQVANQTQQLSDTEQSAINQVALQYGIKVQPGDTLATITAKAAPMASAAQKVDLQQKLAQINELNGQANYYNDRGASAANGPALTDTQQTAANNAWVNGVLSKPASTIAGTKGTPILDKDNGKLTPEGFKFMVSNSGLPINDFIQNYASYIATDSDGTPMSSYGLTAAQKKLITG